jgi:hypothetical protein
VITDTTVDSGVLHLRPWVAIGRDHASVGLKWVTSRSSLQSWCRMLLNELSELEGERLQITVDKSTTRKSDEKLQDCKYAKVLMVIIIWKGTLCFGKQDNFNPSVCWAIHIGLDAHRYGLPDEPSSIHVVYEYRA